MHYHNIIHLYTQFTNKYTHTTSLITDLVQNSHANLTWYSAFAIKF